MGFFVYTISNIFFLKTKTKFKSRPGSIALWRIFGPSRNHIYNLTRTWNWVVVFLSSVCCLYLPRGIRIHARLNPTADLWLHMQRAALFSWHAPPCPLNTLSPLSLHLFGPPENKILCLAQVGLGCDGHAWLTEWEEAQQEETNKKDNSWEGAGEETEAREEPRQLRTSKVALTVWRISEGRKSIGNGVRE